ncbi:6-bladed beta-propeller [Roseivirga sp.]|uniref:6-bladed beta-propeller n=1 Tax=Roseivirga sp. TaxID=1964215 RepID=UPI002B264B18|nr:6-bladed beta-propeller [Roseivirga sp.]
MNKFVSTILATIVVLVSSCEKKGSEYKVQDQKVPIFQNAEHQVALDFKEFDTDDSKSLTIQIDLDDYFRKGVNISAFSKNLSYTILEASDNSLIGEIDNLFFNNDDLVIADSKIAKSVFKFKSDGTFLSKIGRYGQGPGEYLSPTNVSVDNEEIYIHSEFQGRIFVYAQDGSFKKDYRIPFLFDDFHHQGDDFLFNTFNRINGHIPTIANYMIVATSDQSLQIKNTGFYFDPELYMKLRTGYDNRLVRSGDDFFFIQPFTSDIHQIDLEASKITELIHLDLGDKWLKKEALTEILKRNPINIRSQIMEKGMAVIEELLVGDKYFMIKILYKNRLLKFFISRTTGEVTGGAVLIDDIDQLTTIEPSFLIGSKIISLIEPSKLLSIAEKIKEEKPHDYAELLKKIPQIKSLQSSDNIIIRTHEIN